MSRRRAMKAAAPSAPSPDTTTPPAPDRVPSALDWRVPENSSERYLLLATHRAKGAPDELSADAADAAAKIWINTAPPAHAKVDRHNVGILARCLIADASVHDGVIRPERALHRAAASRWAQSDVTHSKKTVRDYMFVVEKAGALVHPQEYPVKPPPRADKRPLCEPESRANIVALEAGIKTISGITQVKAQLAVDLTLGAGARSREIPGMTGRDVQAVPTPDGTLAIVRLVNGSGKVREVPVADPARAARICEAAVDAGEGPLYPGESHRRVEWTTGHLLRLNIAPRLNLAGLRTAWMVDQCLSGMTAHELIGYGDLGESRTVAELARFLPPPDARATLKRAGGRVS